MMLSHVQTLLESATERFQPYPIRGRVVQVAGTVIRAAVPNVGIGELCILHTPGDIRPLKAEVVGFENNLALLTPMGEMEGVSTNTQVMATGLRHQVRVGIQLKNRILDGMGQPLDLDINGPLSCPESRDVNADPPSPLSRKLIDRPLNTGIRAIDALLSVGIGQRIGVFAAAGAGKSTLLGMLVNQADVDVTVIALIGERGREVREFIEHTLGPKGMAKSILIVSTSDRPAMERVKAAQVATTIAEYFRDQGKRVLMVMDSVTRFARAQREIGLAAGEAPTRRGFPPSVFANLPKLMERTGNGDRGSITAFYSVLVEGDDMTEPVADETRSILDGHIVLSRELASANHYPAIDVLDSLSRVMSQIVSPAHMKAAARMRTLLAKYKEVELLVRVGEYQKGGDLEADEAVEKIQKIREFLQQPTDERTDFSQTLKHMRALIAA